MRMKTLGSMVALALACACTPAQAATCDRNATTNTFASELAAATAGQTICLASGSYGTFAGTNKPVTIAAAPGATPSMAFDWTTGDQGFTLDGLRITGGAIRGAANHITVRNSDFTGGVVVDGPTNSAILFDHNVHHDLNGTRVTAAFHFSYGSSQPSGVTIQNSVFRNLSADGVQTGLAVSIVGNEFDHVTPSAAGGNSSIHTDGVQLFTGCSGGTGSVLRGNYFHDGEQAVGAFDGTCGNVIEDNVIQNYTAHWITLGGDRPGSTVRHNTLWGSSSSRRIDCTSKTGAPSSQTALYDNISPIDLTSGSVDCTPSRNDHNLTGTSGVQFVGGANPTTYAGFALAAGSAGKGAASDGTDQGARIGSTTPDPTPDPTDTPADAVWTAPATATVGMPVTLDGTASTGDAPLSCTWRFEYSGGSLVQSRSGCSITFTFQSAGTKYVRLVVTDADGDTDNQLRTFNVAAA